MSDNAVPLDIDDSAVEAFCKAIGELILWANFVDQQLNCAVISLLTLPQHMMIEPVVAQLDPRQKIELLKGRAKLMPAEQWRKPILKWAKNVEEVNRKRNVVAHHRIHHVDGVLVLHSDQINKIMSSLEISDGRVRPKSLIGLSDILAWIEQAKKTVGDGRSLLANLERFREIALARHDPVTPS